MTTSKSYNYYSRRTEKGEDVEYNSPEELLSAATGYFKWCDDNPWLKKEGVKSGTRTGDIIEIPMSRPYTMDGLCVHIGISVKTFHRYENKDDFSQVISHINQVIRQNQTEGAIIGIYNANIISRILGESDKQEPADSEKANILVIESDSPKTKENIATLRKILSHQ